MSPTPDDNLSDRDLADLGALDAASTPPPPEQPTWTERTGEPCPDPDCDVDLVYDAPTRRLFCPRTNGAHFDEYLRSVVVAAPESPGEPVSGDPAAPGPESPDPAADGLGDASEAAQQEAAFDNLIAVVRQAPAFVAAIQMLATNVANQPVAFNLLPYPPMPEIGTLVIGTASGPQITFWSKEGLAGLRQMIDVFLGDRGGLVAPTPSDIAAVTQLPPPKANGSR